MAFPPGLSPKTVTIGIGSFYNGDLVTGRATITAPVNVVHTPSNRPIFSGEMSRVFVDGEASWNLVPTDAPGLNRKDWTYKLKVEVSGALIQPDPIYFTLPTNGPDTVDLDSLVTVPSSAGVPVAVNVLTAQDFGPSLLAELNNSASPTTVALKAAFVPTPSGGTDGQALVKSGNSIAWGSAGLTATQIAADATVRTAFASAKPSVGERLRRASARAAKRNSPDLGVMATPPTVTTATTADATLTKNYRTSSGLASSFRVTGGAAQQGTNTWANYLMAPSVTRPSGAGGNTTGDATKQTYGWSVEFMTDAPKIGLRLLGMSAATPAQIEVDDQPVAATGTTTNTASGTNYIFLDFVAVSKVRKIRVEMQQASGWDGAYVGPTYSIWPPTSDTALRVVTVGDSVDAGTGTTLPNGAWNKVAGKLLGWTDVRQVSYGGTGFVNAGAYNTIGAALRVSDAVAHNPDLLVISASQNDDAATAATITAAALATFQAYRTALPTVPIVVVGVDAGSSGPSVARLTNDTAAKAAFDQWADGNSWWIPNAADPSGSWQYGTGTTGAPAGTGNRDRFGFDSAHPNDAGHNFLGYRFAEAFRTLALPNIR